MYELVVGFSLKEDEQKEATNDCGEAGGEKAAGILQSRIARPVARAMSDLK